MCFTKDVPSANDSRQYEHKRWRFHRLGGCSLRCSTKLKTDHTKEKKWDPNSHKKTQSIRKLTFQRTWKSSSTSAPCTWTCSITAAASTASSWTTRQKRGRTARRTRSRRKLTGWPCPREERPRVWCLPVPQLGWATHSSTLSRAPTCPRRCGSVGSPSRGACSAVEKRWKIRTSGTTQELVFEIKRANYLCKIIILVIKLLLQVIIIILFKIVAIW